MWANSQRGRLFGYLLESAVLHSDAESPRVEVSVEVDSPISEPSESIPGRPTEDAYRSSRGRRNRKTERRLTCVIKCKLTVNRRVNGRRGVSGLVGFVVRRNEERKTSEASLQDERRVEPARIDLRIHDSG